MLETIVLSTALHLGAAAHSRGDHENAAKLYEEAWMQGAKNGRLAYNLGLVYHEQSRLGEAMAAFLKARELLPRNPDVAANLAFLAAKIPDRLDTELAKSSIESATAWLGLLTPREYAWISAALAAVIGMGLIFAQLGKSMRRALRPLVVALLLPLSTLTALAWRLQQGETWGAVTAASATVHAAPGAKTALFELRVGAPFVADETRDGWTRIRLSDGKKGWIADTDVKVLR